MLTRIYRVALLPALAMLAWGCGPQTDKAPDGASDEGKKTAAGSEGGAPVAIEGAYNPKADPLVNPPDLFRPFPEDNPSSANQDATLNRLIVGNPVNLNPIFQSSAYEQEIVGLLFDMLFNYDAKMDWFVNDSMVASFEESADHITNTVKLRPGLKWQDGRPFTAHDVAFSFEAIMDERVPATAVKTGTDQIAKVEAPDELTVVFTHKEALPTNRLNMAFPIVPSHIFENPEERAKHPDLKTGDYYNRYGREEIIGNGPYKFVEWITNDRIVLERWDGYHGPKPHFQRLILKLQEDRNVAFLMFKKTDVDEMELTPQMFATQTNDEEFARIGSKVLGEQWSFGCIIWNMDGSNPFFNDVRVRRAMAHAFDYDRFITQHMFNLVTRSHGIYHPEAKMFNPEVKLIEFDLEKAASLLDEAGWMASDDDGWRYKDVNGRKVKFEFTLLYGQGSTTAPKMAAMMAQDLKKIGVSLLQRTMEWATMSEALEKHEFQATTIRWGTGTDPDTAWNLWRTEAAKDGRNYGSYSNKRVDELFDLARHEFDETKRMSHYAEIQKILYDEQPYVWVWTDPVTWAISKRMSGVTLSPRGVFGFYPAEFAWWTPAASTQP